jgi:hypothetical protein
LLFFTYFTDCSNMLDICGLKYIYSCYFHIHNRSFIQWKIFDRAEFNFGLFTCFIPQFKNSSFHFTWLPKLSLYNISGLLVLQQRLEAIATSGCRNDFYMLDIYLSTDSRITLILFWEETIYWVHRRAWVCQES